MRTLLLRLFVSAVFLRTVATIASAAPSVSVTAPISGATVSELTTVSVSFSEAVAGVDAADLLVNGEAATSVSGSGAGPYVFTFTQPRPGSVSVAWDVDHGITGLGTGAFAASGGWSYTLTDVVAPTIAKIRTSVPGEELDAIAPLPGSTVGSLTNVEVAFSEPVTGVDAADLRINGITATSLLVTSTGAYVFAFSEPAPGPVNFSWAPGHNIRDTSPAANAFVANSWSVTRSSGGSGTLVINEFLAANASSIKDEDGEPSGWIEVYNPTPNAVNLAGWALTNDPHTPRLWVFPSRVLAANSYLVVFTSEKDRRPASGNLHTNFKINPNGGYLALNPPDMPTVVGSNFDPYPAQRYDYSYGLQSGGGFRYFARPTATTDSRPGSANPTSSLTSVTPRPNASVSRGFFNDPFQVILSCTDASATIRYTLDGSEPLSTSAIYSGPLNITGTALLRAAAFGGAAVPSEAVTHSYIFPEQVFSQPSPPYDNPSRSDDNANPALPTVGGVPLPIHWGSGGGGLPGLITNLPSGTNVPADYGMDSEVWNDPAKYADNGTVDNANGKTNRDRIRQGLKDLPSLSVVLSIDDMFGPNGIHPKSTQKSPPIEKPCSVEFLLPDGSSGFATTCGIRPHGNSSRLPENTPKKGFTLKFKGDYGAANLEYKLFADSAVRKLDDLILRADYNVSWGHWDPTQRTRATRQRDAWAKETFRVMGRAAGHHRYVNLFINGIYWGTYDITEQENDTFAENHFGGDNSDYEVVEQGVVKSGSGSAYNTLVSLASSVSTIDNTRYEQIKQYLDVPWFIDYMLLHFYEGHQDWGPAKNWYAIRDAARNGTFKYIPWDQENILLDNGVNVTSVAPPSNLHSKLITNAQYRLDFADRVHRHMVALDGALQPQACIDRWNRWRGLLANALVGESARWGDYRRDVHVRGTASLYTWNTHALAEHARLTGSYFPQRTNTVLGQLRGLTQPLYPTLNAPEIRDNATNQVISSQRVSTGFKAKLNLLSPAPSGTSSVGTIYFTTNGVDPRVYYSGSVATTAQAYTTPITINSTTTLKTRVLNAGTWSALNEVTLTVGAPLVPPVRITEIMYNPPGGTAHEFLEFQNTGTQPVNMQGWYMEGVEFVFPVGTVLGPGDRLVIASNDNPVSWAARYPGVTPLGYYGGSLDNAGETLVLKDANGGIVVSVEYGDRSPWPREADGSGYSLEIIDPAGDPDVPENWRASAAAGGTPGLANTTKPSSAVELSEVMVLNTTVSNAGLFSPYIELRNTSGAAVSVGNWQLSVSSGSYTLPGTASVPANGRLVIWLDAATGGTGLHAGDLGIDAKMDVVRLFRPGETVPVDLVAFRWQVPGFSIGRVGAAGSGWALTQASPGAANIAASLAPGSSVVLNEWLANQGPFDTDDWVELHNKHTSLPAAIQGFYLQSDKQLARIPYLGFIAPGGFVQLQLGEKARAIDVKLPATGTSLALLDSNGDLRDSVTVTSQPPGVSEGRYPDGATSIFSFGYNITPGAPNFRISDYTGPILNELLIVNRFGDLAPWGERVPWVELFNPGASEFDLSGYGVTGYGLPSLTSPSSSLIYRFPAGTKIPAQGYKTVWLSVPPNGASVPADTLATAIVPVGGARGTIHLLDAANRVLDTVEWGHQVADRSIGRSGGFWKLLASRTRNGVNSAPAPLGPISSVKLNEWLAAPASGGDFVELYNNSDSPVELSGMYLTDDPSSSGLTKTQILPLSFIGPKDWVNFYAAGSVGSPLDGTVDFSLEKQGEFIRLSASDLSLLDSVSFGPQTTGLSMGRILDGEAIVLGLTPTPGARNMLLPAPSITEQPVSRTVAVGGTASFSMSATGSDPLSYQWLFEGTPIPGATGATLNIATVHAGHDGRYTCEVRNSAGAITSNSAQLIVQSGFADWCARYFSAAELANPAISGAGADPDGDGLSNLQEFFHGLNPANPASMLDRDALPMIGLEPPTGTPQFVTLTFRRSARAILAAAELEVAPTITGNPWTTTLPSTIEQLGADPETGDTRVRWKVPVATGEKNKFLRLRLTP